MGPATGPAPETQIDSKLVIVLMITNTPTLEQGKQKYIYVIISFLYIQYVSDLFVCLILPDKKQIIIFSERVFHV